MQNLPWTSPQVQGRQRSVLDVYCACVGWQQNQARRRCAATQLCVLHTGQTGAARIPGVVPAARSNKGISQLGCPEEQEMQGGKNFR